VEDGPSSVAVPAELDGLVLGLDHVGVAVRDLDEAVERYTMALGVSVVHRETVESQGVDEVLLALGPSFLQLVGARGPDTPVGRFLERRGEGVHHVGIRVTSVRAALDRLRAAGVALVDEEPRNGSRGATIAFVHPSGLHGVLLELVEAT
jgi:methylmalonyl-CoA/ethylmalonyl-CoA epimerase